MALRINIAPMAVGDLRPLLDLYLEHGDHSPVDLTLADSVTFSMREQNAAVNKVNGQAASIIVAADGHVRYTWQAGDTDTAGIYIPFVIVYWSSGPGTPQTFGGGQIPIRDAWELISA